MNYNGTLSHLDLTLCSIHLATGLNCEVLDDTWGSDHFPLCVTMTQNIPKTVLSTKNKQNFNKADWALFKTCIHDELQKVDSYDAGDATEMYHELIAKLKLASKKSIPIKNGTFKHKYSPFWNSECSKWKKLKKDAEKKLRKENNVNNQITFKRNRAKFKLVISEAKKNYWEKYCSELSYHSKLSNVWTTVRNLKGNSRQNKISLNIKGKQLQDKKEIANEFANMYKEISSNKNLDNDVINLRRNTVIQMLETKKQIDKKTGDLVKTDITSLNDHFNINELENVLSTLNKKSSPGIDEVPYLYYINSPDSAKEFLLKILNKSWETGEIPVNWKQALVKPILKPSKDKNDPNSYRPISLTNTISKIMEKMITNRLKWFLEKNKSLNKNQSGFRKNCSTNDPIIRLKYEAEHALSSGNLTVAVLIDFSRAFDLLWVDGMLLKLMQLNIEGNMLRWIKNFLTERQNQVMIDEDLSDVYQLENGTPQGSSISPILFLIMINDFPPLSENTAQALFADDCTVWRSGKNMYQIIHHLQIDLLEIESWCNKWGFKINVEKTIGITFTNQKCNVCQPNLKINGKLITFGKTCMLLEVLFDSHLTWKPHIEYICEKMKMRLNLMRCLCGTEWGASKRILLTIYRALILSVMDYCCFVYSDSAGSNLKLLDTIQYKSLLLATGGIKGTALKALLAECGELPLKLRREQLTLKYLVKIKKTINKMVHI